MPKIERRENVAFTIETRFRSLVGLKLIKSWNIFGTRLFYFAQTCAPTHRSDYRLTIECPWRLEQDGLIIVGSEDFGLRADSNANPDWDPSKDQSGHLQDELLAQVLGSEMNGEIICSASDWVVESVQADNLGGFVIHMSGALTLRAFPTSRSSLEWLLSDNSGNTLCLERDLKDSST